MEKIKKVFDAVVGVTGISRDLIESKARSGEVYYARMIVTHHLQAHGISVTDICPLVGVMHPEAILYHLRMYHRDRTPYFRACAKKVEELLREENNSV